VISRFPFLRQDIFPLSARARRRSTRHGFRSATEDLFLDLVLATRIARSWFIDFRSWFFCAAKLRSPAQGFVLTLDFPVAANDFSRCLILCLGLVTVCSCESLREYFLLCAVRLCRRGFVLGSLLSNFCFSSWIRTAICVLISFSSLL
jgi:hypothetical protein